MKSTPIIFSLLGIFLLLTACHEPDMTTNETGINLKSTAVKKVLVVGIDGCQYEKISDVDTPNMDAFNMTKALAGGITGTSSEQATSSGPGWMSILTGVWVNKHGVPNNSSGTYKSQAKSVYQYIKEANPALTISSIATWSPIHEFLQDQMSFVDHRYDGGDDDDALNRAIYEVNTNSPDLLFVHFDNIDHVGHASGFSTSYNNSIKDMDNRLGQLMNAVNQHAQQNNEDWLIILVTDHGREPAGGYSHGGQTESEKTIFIGMNKVGNEEFTSTVNQVPNQAFNGIYGYPSQTSVTPTVLSYLGVDIDANWQLESTSLIGNVGPRKVMFDTNNNLYWYSQSPADAQIYRNNELIATVPATQGSYSDSGASFGKVNYTIVVDGQTGSVQKNNSKIIAGLDWNDALDNVAYFFRSDMSYVKYNKSSDAAYSGYPKPVDNSTWSGLDGYKDKINAAFKWSNDKGFFFLNDGTYLRYDMNNDAVDGGYPKPINNNRWPGLEGYGDKIIAAVKWDQTKVYFFLNNGTYIRYSITNDSMDSGYPKAINNSTWPGVGNYANNITSAVDWSAQYFYIFLDNNTYIKYDKYSDSAVSGYPKPVNNSTWPGLMN